MRPLTSLIIGFFLANIASAQETGALSLAQCMKQAFATNNILHVAELQIEAAQAQLAQSKQQRLPSLTAQGTYLRIGKVSSFSIPMGPGGAIRTFKFGTPNRVNAGVNLAAPLFTWGRIEKQIEMAAIGVDLQQTDQKQKQLEVTNQVLRAWYSTLISQQAVNAAEINLKRAQKNQETTRARYEKGLAPKLEMLQAQVQATNAQTMLDDSRSALEASKIFLAKVIGRKDQNFVVKGELTYTPLMLDADSLISRALAERYDLAAFALQRQLLEKQTKVIQTAVRPSVMGIGGYSLQNGFSPMNPEEFVDNWNVGIQLNLPLFDGGITRRKIEETSKQIDILDYQEKEIRELVAMQIKQALVALERADKNVLAQTENITLAQEALNSAEQQYNNGLASSLDLITAQQTLAQTELGLLRAKYQHVAAKIDLCKAIADYSLFQEALDNSPHGQ